MTSGARAIGAPSPLGSWPGRKTSLNEAVPAVFDNAEEKPYFIILYDELKGTYSNDECGLFTKGSNHRNISDMITKVLIFIGCTVAMSR